MDFENIYSTLKENIKKLFINLAFIFCFWALAIFIVKPSFTENPLHIQFVLTFCLSFIWLLTYFIITVLLVTLFTKVNIYIVLELGNFISILSLCIFINIAYTNSYSLTSLLKSSFSFSICAFVVLSILNFGIHIHKNRKVKQ